MCVQYRQRPDGGGGSPGAGVTEAVNTVFEGVRAVYVDAGALQSEKKGGEGGLGRWGSG